MIKDQKKYGVCTIFRNLFGNYTLVYKTPQGVQSKDGISWNELRCEFGLEDTEYLLGSDNDESHCFYITDHALDNMGV